MRDLSNIPPKDTDFSRAERRMHGVELVDICYSLIKWHQEKIAADRQTIVTLEIARETEDFDPEHFAHLIGARSWGLDRLYLWFVFDGRK